MQASTSSLLPILGGQNQYIIPLFQRYYSWGRPNWTGMWEGVTELLDEASGARRHFMGPLVFVPAVNDVVAPRILVIDGQQRLITLSLLLCALRDVSAARGYDDLAREIEGKYLLDPFHRDAEHLHVLPRQRDRADYVAAVLHLSRPTGVIAQALVFFTQRVSEVAKSGGEDHLRAFVAALLGGLEFVVITLEHENAYEIFQSLNATGVPLSEADLIRNFVFMNVAVEEQIAFDDHHWQPLEDTMGPVQTRSVTLTRFFRDFLMKDGTYIRPRATFATFEKRYTGADWTAQGLAQELKRYAGYDRVLRGVDPAPPNITGPLARLHALDSATTRPLLLNLMNRIHAGKMTEAELAEAIEMLAGFILRRLVCRESSRTYAQWFVTACGRLGDAPVKNLHAFLLARRYPSDARFREAFLRFNLYGSAYARSILMALEGAEKHGEPANLAKATVEHIMPQTLTPVWREELGPESDRIYAEWLHTPGNLTITGYNPALGNRPFSEKRLLFADSNVRMNRELAHKEAWNEEAIRGRGEALAERAVGLWPGPQEEPVAVEEPEQQPDPESGTTSGELFAEYWDTLLARMRDHGSALPRAAAPDGNELWIHTGVPGVSLHAFGWSEGRNFGVGIQLWIGGPEHYATYRALHRRKKEIEEQFGRWLYWEAMRESDRSQLALLMTRANPGNRARWDEQHAWLEQYLEAMMRVVVPALAEIVPGGSETEEEQAG